MVRTAKKPGVPGPSGQRAEQRPGQRPEQRPEQRKKPKFEIVLKCDSRGSAEAVADSIAGLSTPDVAVTVIHSGVGDISKSDVLFAETASRLIVGFQVGVVHSLEKVLREHRVDVRLYQVIYELLADIKAAAGELIPHEPEEQVIGSGTIIALFKSSRKGTIIGCEVREGYFAVGERFRIISAMGPVYQGVIESLHRGDAAVPKALPGQQAGIRIKNFNRAKVGDIVESFRPPPPAKVRAGGPTGRIIRR
ncbi:MAG: hypothetical protein U0411_03305 [Thermodesulfovibrionales bacterium]